MFKYWFTLMVFDHVAGCRSFSEYDLYSTFYSSDFTKFLDVCLYQFHLSGIANTTVSKGPTTSIVVKVYVSIT